MKYLITLFTTITFSSLLTWLAIVLSVMIRDYWKEYTRFRNVVDSISSYCPQCGNLTTPVKTMTNNRYIFVCTSCEYTYKHTLSYKPL